MGGVGGGGGGGGRGGRRERERASMSSTEPKWRRCRNGTRAKSVRCRSSKRLRRGRRAKAANGGYAGGNAPIGYKRERHTRKLMIDPEKAEVVKHVFRIKKRHRRMTLDEIAASLHEAGYTASSGRKF